MELLGIEQADANGDKVDMTTSTAAITNSTAVMMTSVAGDPNAIGYISLGSLDDTVKAVSIDGVAPSAAAVKDGSYAIARPFNVVTKGDLSAPAADFFAFIMSADGQAVVSDNNYIAIDDAAAPFASNGASGKAVSYTHLDVYKRQVWGSLRISALNWHFSATSGPQWQRRPAPVDHFCPQLALSRENRKMAFAKMAQRKDLQHVVRTRFLRKLAAARAKNRARNPHSTARSNPTAARSAPRSMTARRASTP